MSKRVHSQWQANAVVYAQLIDDKGTPHHREILNPCLEQLIGDVQGRKILDAGCGEGYLSRFYAQKGARVTGVDLSETLVNISKKRSKHLPIEFKVGNICNLDAFSAEEFDIVLCNLVLLNLDCLQKSLREFHRVLRPRGVLVFSIVHPAFNVYGPGRWELGNKDSQSPRRRGRYFVINNYFLEKEYQVFWQTRKGADFPKAFSFFHRTISTYVNALLSVGFRLTAFEEPRPVSEGSFFNREHRIPFFLVLRGEK